MTRTNRFPFIGITGGIGAGKSRIIDFIESNYNAKVLLADDVAKDLMKMGTSTYDEIKAAFSDYDILRNDGELDRDKLAKIVFSNKEALMKLNSIVHPAVKESVVEIYREEAEKGKYDCFFLEAALLIEEHYDEICDELWYIYASEETRRDRLKNSRGYSDEKISEIFRNQLKEDVFREKCEVVIDNNGDFSKCEMDIRENIEKLWE